MNRRQLIYSLIFPCLNMVLSLLLALSIGGFAVPFMIITGVAPFLLTVLCKIDTGDSIKSRVILLSISSVICFLSWLTSSRDIILYTSLLLIMISGFVYVYIILPENYLSRREIVIKWLIMALSNPINSYCAIIVLLIASLR